MKSSAVYKSGTGTWGRVCGDLGLGDVKYGTRGRVGRGRGGDNDY